MVVLTWNIDKQKITFNLLNLEIEKHLQALKQNLNVCNIIIRLRCKKRKFIMSKAFVKLTNDYAYGDDLWYSHGLHLGLWLHKYIIQVSFSKFSGWVIQTIFIDCSNPDSCQESNKTNESNQQCPNFLLSASEDGTIKLWDLTNKGAIVLNLEQCAGISCMIASKLKGMMANFLH